MDWNAIWQSILGWPLWRWWNPVGFLHTLPSAEWSLRWWYVGFGGVITLIGLLCLFPIKIPGELRTRVRDVTLQSVPAFLLFYLLRDQQVPILGMDIWRTLHSCAIILWLVTVIRSELRTVPTDTTQAAVAAYRNRFLPKPKSSVRA